MLLKGPEEGALPGSGEKGLSAVLPLPRDSGLPSGHSLVGTGDGEGLGAMPGRARASGQTHTRTCVGACTHLYTARRRGPQLVGG